MARFRPAPDLDQKAAVLVADDLMQVARQVEAVAKRLAPPTKDWVSQRDGRVRSQHVEADSDQGPFSKAIPDNLRFELTSYDWDRQHRRVGEKTYMRFPRDGTSMRITDTTFPGVAIVHCFPAGTLVRPIGDLRSVMRAPYAGPMVTVTTRSGRVLTGTPNHPVLTHRGWVGLGRLDVGDDLFDAGWGQVDFAATEPVDVHPHVEDTPLPIDEVFESAAQMYGAQRVAAGAVDFHGDRPAGEVDVVHTDGGLWDRIQAVRAQRLLDLPLAELAPRLRVRLSQAGAPFEGRERVLLAAPGGVRRGHERHAFLGGRAAHASVHRRSATAWLDAGGQQGLPDDPSGDVVLASKGKLGRALLVLPRDAVADVRVEDDWSGHVYTLSTSTDSFGANGLVVRNCRCFVEFDPEGIARLIRTEPPVLRGRKLVATVVCEGRLVVEAEFGWTYPGDLVALGTFFMGRAARFTANKRNRARR